MRGAEATLYEFSRTCPGVAQITETVHTIGGNHKEAKKVRVGLIVGWDSHFFVCHF